MQLQQPHKRTQWIFLNVYFHRFVLAFYFMNSYRFVKLLIHDDAFE